MRNLMRISSFAVLGASAIFAQPSIDTRGIVNAASFAKVALPNSSIAQGSFFTIFGSNLGPAKSPSLAFPLQTTLGGVSLTVAAGGQNFSAVPLFVGPGQINAVLPSNVPVGPATLTVNFNGTSNAEPFQVIAHSFGIFTVAQSGSGPGVIDNASYSQYGLSNAALAGDTAIIWGTGLTAVAAAKEFDGPSPGNQPNVPVEVYVGLTKAKVTYQGRSGCCVGVDQIFFTVPSGITGCEIPVAVKIGNVVSNFVTMPIAGASSSGTNQEHATASRVCTDAGGPSQTSIAEYLKNGFSGGFIGLDRSVTTSPALPPPIGTGSPTTSTTDTGSGSFAKVSAASLSVAVNPFQVTTIGTCTVFAFAGQSAVSPTNITSTVLDAGPALTVNGPHGAMQLPKSSGGGYYAQLGGGSSGGLGFFTNPAYGINAATVMPLYLDPGDYTVTGPGGADVGPFTAKITIAPPLTWTNESSISTVIRANGQLVTWTGGDPMSTVIISGSSIQLGTNPDGSDTLGAFFTCYAPDSAGQFDIPALVLDVLPPSSVIPEVNIPAGSLSIGTDQNASFTAKGLDIGTISSNVTIGNTVAYQ